MVVDLLAWYYLLRERVFWIVAGVIFTTALAVVYLKVKRPIYTAQCVVQVEPESRVLSIKMEEANVEEFKTLEALKTVEGALSSRSLMVRVVKSNKLDREDPDFQAPPGSPALTDSDLADLMSAKVDVKLRRGTRLIDITVDDTDPKRAARLAASVVDGYTRQNYEQKAEATRMANETLFKQRDELKQRLEKSEQDLQTYREKYGVLTLEMSLDGKQTTSLQNFTAEKLKEINRQVQEARSERIKLEGVLPIVKRAPTMTLDELLSIEAVGKATEVVELQKLLAAKESEFGDVRKRYLELHPKYQQVQSQLKDLRESLDKSARKAAMTVVNSHESALDAENKLQTALAEQERVGVELSRVAIPFNVLLRDTQADRELYDQVSTRVREIELSNEIEKSNIRVIQVPDIPVDPSKPKKSLVLALAMLFGFCVPTVGIVLTQAFNTTLRSVDEAESAMNLPSLAAVPQARGKAARSPLVMIDNPAGREAEAFRCLRTSLALLTPDGGAGKTVLITSAVPSEGKSYCASNYAVALAQQGLSTLLIDADLRRPGLGQYLPINPDSAGLSEVLAGRTTLANATHGTSVEKLKLMPAGTKGTNPAELLGSPAFGKLLTEAEGLYDRIVIDTAPVNAVSDTLLLVDKVDAVVVVVRARKTPARVLRRAQHMLELANAPLAGFVLNRLPSRLANYYYYDEGSYSSAGVYGT